MAKLDFDRQLQEILEEYTDEVIQAVDESIDETAEWTKEELHSTSPVGARGKYAKGWKVKQADTRLRTVRIVHNPTQYRLTHLLEKGHAMWFGGRARAIPHIAPAESKASELIERKLIQKLT